MPGEWQEALDTFYFRHGSCCAGCDWWQSLSATVGECTRSAPVSGSERASMLGIDWTTLPFSAGHALTKREHKCGEFKDDFDWTTLPLPYRKRIGELNRNRHQKEPVK